MAGCFFQICAYVESKIQGFQLKLLSIFEVQATNSGPGSSAGIATAYGLDGPGIELIEGDMLISIVL